MIDANAMVKELQSGVIKILKQSAGEYLDQARQDSKDFIDSAKPLLLKWSQQVSQGVLSTEDLKFLLQGRLKELAQMKSLTEAGIAAATLDAARGRIVDLVMTVVSKQIL